MTNVEPPDDIPPNWRSTFRGQYGDCVQSRLKAYREEREDEYRDKLKTDIANDKRHRQLLNLCIFPFVEYQPLGYEFIRADPLEELGEPNFDFLLFDFDGHAIFGECKANIGEGWESECVKDVIKEREAVEKHEDYIVENYLGSEIRHKEFVLAVFSPDADQITREILKQKEKIVTWRVHRMEDKRINVNTSAPPREDWPEDPDEYYDLIQHDHHALNSKLRQLKSSTECFDLFPESYPVTELRTLITARHKVTGSCYVDQDTLLQTIRDSLYYLTDERQDEILNSIIKDAKEINYLRDWDGDEGDYKIVSRYTDSDGLEETLSSKWIEYKVEEEKDGIRNSCWNEVHEEILSIAKAQTELDDYS